MIWPLTALKRCRRMNPKVGIYKGKQESKKKERKHTGDQESDQEKKKVFRLKY